MSKAVDEEDEDECFYESLDRIVSSSCSSCSTSDDDNDLDSDDRRRRQQRQCPDSANYARGGCDDDDEEDGADFPIPRFPMRVSNYDVWISEPSSVSDRRLRLLREMGLSADPSLSRSKPVPGGLENAADIARSVSYDQLTRSYAAAEGSGIVRSKSDGGKGDRLCNCPCSCSSPVEASCCCCCCGCSEGGLFVHSHKPPSGRNSKRSSSTTAAGDEIRPAIDSTPGTISLSNSNQNLGEQIEVSESDESNRTNEEARVCTIRDLDNGKEFVVNEVREDGTWNKLKEVGTGRQLTMEEFQLCVGHSPIVQELMRRQNVDGLDSSANGVAVGSSAGGAGSGSSKTKKKGGSWFKTIKSAVKRERRSSDERDTSSEKGGRRSSSATDDSQQEASFQGPERVRVRHYGKSSKDLTALYKTQEIQAHNGSIWSIKFSLDGQHLASAGEDCVIHIWRVVESEKKGDLLMEKAEDGGSTTALNMFFVANGSPEPSSVSPNDPVEKKRRGGRASVSRKSMSLDHVFVPDTVFALSDKPFCSFQGHLDDVLDLSWSKSQHLLSSSMDKTVRLWHLSSQTCLKIFSHSDYVTCIQFNPVNDNYFISGSLDAKVRIWSIPKRQVVDWNDLHEMVTAACYTPDGQGALVGSYKGSCRLYNTSENKLLHKSNINLQNKKKKSHHKKITGFQFAPGSSSEVLVTSSDSRVRVVDGVDLVHKFKGFRNTNTQISASVTENGRYVVAASEDSHVYIWKHETDSRPGRSKGVTVTRSYEHFHCQDVSAAVPWPGMADSWGLQDDHHLHNHHQTAGLDEVSTANHPPTPVEAEAIIEGSRPASGCTNSPLHGTISGASNSYFFDRIAATWPEEKLLLAARNRSPRVSADFGSGVTQNVSAWGMVVVTAGLRGEIKTFQNFGLPIRI